MSDYELKVIPDVYKIRPNHDIDAIAEKLRFIAAKNEKTSFQVVVKSRIYTEKFFFSVFCKNCDAVRIDSYREHFIEVQPCNTVFYAAGKHPDALIPLPVSGDSPLTVESEALSVFFVDVHIPNLTNVDKIQLVIKTRIGGEEENKNIDVDIYDIHIPEKPSCKSAIMIWSDKMIGYEEKVDNALMRAYYDELLKYRLNGAGMPLVDASDTDGWIEAAKIYTKDERVTAINLPWRWEKDRLTGMNILDKAHFKSSLKKIVEQSSDRLNLLEKAFLYCLDEPQPKNFWQIESVHKTVRDSISELCDEMNFDGKEQVLKSLRGIPLLLTPFENTPKLFDKFEIWCPSVAVYQDRENMARFQDRRRLGEELWWYSCVLPKEPYFNYQIESPKIVGIRACTYMMKKYGIVGLLNWSLNIYCKCENDRHLYRDVWKDPVAFPDANGDGFLIYPSDQPDKVFFPTLRLMNIRNSMYDYELLCILESEIEKFNARNETKLDKEKLMDEIYQSLFDKAVSLCDEEQVVSMREQVFHAIAALRENRKPKIDVFYEREPFVFDKTVEFNCTVKKKNGGLEYTCGEPIRNSYFAFVFETPIDLTAFHQFGVYANNLRGKFSVLTLYLKDKNGKEQDIDYNYLESNEQKDLRFSLNWEHYMQRNQANSGLFYLKQIRDNQIDLKLDMQNIVEIRIHSDYRETDKVLFSNFYLEKRK